MSHWCRRSCGPGRIPRTCSAMAMALGSSVPCSTASPALLCRLCPCRGASIGPPAVGCASLRANSTCSQTLESDGCGSSPDPEQPRRGGLAGILIHRCEAEAEHLSRAAFQPGPALMPALTDRQRIELAIPPTSSTPSRARRAPSSRPIRLWQRGQRRISRRCARSCGSRAWSRLPI